MKAGVVCRDGDGAVRVDRDVHVLVKEEVVAGALADDAEVVDVGEGDRQPAAVLILVISVSPVA
jgi:hypothetical protein